MNSKDNLLYIKLLQHGISNEKAKLFIIHEGIDDENYNTLSDMILKYGLNDKQIKMIKNYGKQGKKFQR